MKEKTLIKYIYGISIISTILFFGLILITCTYINNEILLCIINCSAIVLYIVQMSFILYIEVHTGKHKCPNCENEFAINYKIAFLASHVGTKRYLKCPKCEEKHYCKKVYKD